MNTSEIYEYIYIFIYFTSIHMNTSDIYEYIQCGTKNSVDWDCSHYFALFLQNSLLEKSNWCKR